jgi:hypothetical protein
MSKPKQDYEKLKAKWYAKLKASGFEDIEQPDGRLKVWHDLYFRCHMDADRIQAAQDYYRLARQFVHDHIFKNPIEKRIWEMHAEGISQKQILAALLKEGKKGIWNWQVQGTIERLTKEMINKCKSKT